MEKEENKQVVKVSPCAPGLCSMMFIAFMVLKLCHVIDWSWWWVTAPLWIPAGLALSVIVLLGIFYIILASCDDKSHPDD